MNDRRIILKDYVTENMVRTEARYNEWLWWDKNSNIEEDRIYEIIFVKPDEKTSIHYIQDYIIKINYILSRGEEADKVIEEAKKSLDCYSWQEILDDYANAADNHYHKISIVYIAGAAAPLEFSSEHKKFFDNLLQDEYPDVRIATIIAMGYMRWIEWIPVLQDLKNNDPDETVRDSAAGMLDSFAANGIGSSSQSIKSTETEEQEQPSSSEESEAEQLQKQLKSDKKQLADFKTRLKKVEARIENARRTNIFGRKQSGNDERERGKLTQEIEEIKQRIIQNESLLESLAEGKSQAKSERTEDNSNR